MTPSPEMLEALVTASRNRRIDVPVAELDQMDSRMRDHLAALFADRPTDDVIVGILLGTAIGLSALTCIPTRAAAVDYLLSSQIGLVGNLSGVS